MFKSNLHLWNICRAHGRRRSRSPPFMPKDTASVWVPARLLLLPSGVNAYFPTSSTSFLTSTAFAGTAQGKFALLPQMEATFWGSNLWAEDRPKSCLTSEGRRAPSQARITHSVPVVRTHCYTQKSMWDVFKLFTVTLLNSTNYKTATVINRLQLIYLIAVNKIIQSLLELGHYIIHYISVTQWF